MGNLKNFLFSYKYLFEASPSNNNASHLLSPYDLPAVLRRLPKLVHFIPARTLWLGITAVREMYLRSNC